MSNPATQSGIYSFGLTGRIRPKILCVQYKRDLIFGPSGWNIILPSGHYSVESLPGSCAAISIQPSGTLNFGSGVTPVTEDPFVSNTIPFVFMPKTDKNNPSISEEITIFNMKLWIENKTAFTDQSLNPYIQMKPSGIWRRNLVLTSGYAGAFEVPSSLPAAQNIFRKDGNTWMSGIGQQQITQIIYSSIIWASGSYPVGHYGGIGLGTFRWRFTYDWTDEFANLTTDDF